MLKAGVIQPSVSEWSSALVLVRKRDGTIRWCVDYRALNSVTTKDVFPLPLVDDCLDTLAGNSWFSKLDATLLIGRYQSTNLIARRRPSSLGMACLSTSTLASDFAMNLRLMPE